MIAHVAEAGEDRGRVLVVLGSAAQPSTAGVEAAAHLARVHAAGMEGLFVEDDQIAHLACYRFASEISRDGRSKRPYSMAVFDDDMSHAFDKFERRVNDAALKAGVPVCTKSVRGAWIESIDAVCREKGPWNVVSLAEPIGPASAKMLAGLLRQVADTTGLLVSAASVRPGDGPVLIVVEDGERLPAMTRLAERVCERGAGQIHVILAADNDEHVRWMESEARLFFSDRLMGNIECVVPVYASPDALAANICSRKASFVIAQFGGLLVPDGDLGVLSNALRCPLFLTR